MEIDNKYLNVIQLILGCGYEYEDPNRKGVIRKEISSVYINHIKDDGYPIITARKTYFKGAVGELLLFLKGSTDIRDFWDYKIEFWNKDYCRMHGLSEEDLKIYKNNRDSFPDEVFSLGRIYGYQYKKQHSVFDKFKENPYRSDLIVNSWQVDDLDKMALIPCHYSFQIVGGPEGFGIVWNQRSTDFILGSPINIQFYFLLGILLEKWSGHDFCGIQGNLNKVHIYNNQMDIAKNLVSYKDVEFPNKAELEINIDDNLKSLPFSEFIKHIEPSMFKLKNYEYILNESVPMLTYNK